jgi:hypothetical protein
MTHVGSADWKTLAGGRLFGRGIDARLAAFHRICATSDPELDTLCVTFVDEVVASGDVKRALERAARERPAAVPDTPDTGGAAARGPHDLVIKPYALREAIESVIAALGRRSHVRSGLALWLFETAKLWSAERDLSLRAIEEAHVTPDVLARGIDSLVGYAEANPDPGGEILRDVAMAWVGKPGWFSALVARIAASDPASDALADSLYDAEVEAREPFSSSDPVARKARESLLVHALDAPSGARAISLAALATYHDADGIADLVVAALRDPTAHCRVVEAAARLAIARRMYEQPVHEAAEACAGAEGRQGERAREALAEAVAALVVACTTSQRRDVLAPGEHASFVAGLFSITGGAAVDDLAIAAVRRPLALAPSSDWRTDEDEVAVAVAGPNTAAYHVAPVRFPMQKTGASGSRRSVAIAGTLDGRVVILVHSPYMRAGGWGSDNFALGFSPRDRSWVAYRSRDGRLVIASELVATIDASELTSVAFGEVIAWRDDDGMRVVADHTPYHLDDWEHSPELLAAMAARDAAGAESWTPTRVAASRITAACPSWQGEGERAGIAWRDQVAVVLDREIEGGRSALVWLDRSCDQRSST